MTDRRKHRLVDCNPRFVEDGKGAICALYFACPDGHDDCKYVIPFAPALDGSAGNWNNGGSGPIWQRSGSTNVHAPGVDGICSKCGLDDGLQLAILPCAPFESLTLSPSIRCIQRHASKEAALAAGVLEQYFTESLTCALHIFIKDGAIEFCGDSK